MTRPGTTTQIINTLAALLGAQATRQFPDLDTATLGAVLTDTAAALRVMVTESDDRMTGQAVVDVLAAAGERLAAISASEPTADGGETGVLAKRAEAERDELRRRIANARTEIARQDAAASFVMRPGFSDVCDALAAVETHLVDPEYRPAALASVGGAE